MASPAFPLRSFRPPGSFRRASWPQRNSNPWRRQLAGTLSGGERQMCAIARGLMGAPRLLMLDEPSLGLAPRLASEVFRTIHRLEQEGTPVLLVEQAVSRALRVVHFGYVLELGRAALSGPGRDLLDNPHVRRAYLGT